MKKQKNATRVIAIVLVLLMALALIPIAASAETFEISFYDNTDADGGALVTTANTNDSGELAALPSSVSYGSYVLLGWNKDKSAEYPDSACKAESTNVNFTGFFNEDESKVLYAIWGACITLNANDGTESPDTMTCNTSAYGAVTLPNATDAGFSRTGYNFLGWDESATATTATYSAGNATITSSKTLYGVWEMDDPVTISFVPNNPYNPTMPDSITTPRAVRAYAPSASCSGFSFLGWGRDGDNPLTVLYTEGQEIANPASGNTLTLIAMWQDLRVPVYYNSGRGTKGGNTNVDILVGNYERGTGFDLSTIEAQGITPPSGEMFTYWRDGTNSYAAGDPYTVPADAGERVTLTALFAPKCTVSYNSDGGTTYSPKDVPAGTQITLEEPTKDGFTFQAWYRDPAKTLGPHAANSTYTVNSNVTFYADWLSNTIPVTFDHGTGTGTKADTTAPRTGTYSPLPDETGFTAPTDCVFDGWKISVNGAAAGDTVYPAGGSFTVPAGAEALKLIAQWKNTKVVVTFDKNGGTGTNSTQDMSRVTSSNLKTLSELGFTPPSGSVFLGWNTVSTATEPVFEDGESVVWDDDNPCTPTGDTLTLYAIWEAKITGTVTIGRDDEHTNIGDPKVNETLKAYTAGVSSSTLHYRWLLDGTPIEGANTRSYTVPASAYGKKLSVEVSNAADFAYSIKSAELTVGASDEDKAVMTVNFVGDKGGISVTVAGTSITASGQTVNVVKGGKAVVEIGAASGTKYVSKLELGSTTLSGTDVKSSNSMDVPNAATCTLTVTFEDTPETKTATATIDPSADVSEAKNKITTAAKATLPDGQKDRVWVSAFDVVPCWNGNVQMPLVIPDEIPAAGLDFTLDYPSGAGYNNTVKTNMTKYCNIKVYHYKGGALTEVKTGSGVTVTPSDSITGGVSVKGFKDFSDFGVAVTPKDLDKDLSGKVNVSGLTEGKASVGSPLTAEYKSSVATPAGTLSYQWEYKDGSAWKPISGATSASYTPSGAYNGKTLRCKVTSSFETGEVYSVDIQVSAKPEPKWERDIVNNGGVHTGIIKDVTADMQWAGPSTTQPGTSATWHDISGTSFEVTQPGYYWVRMKTDTSCENVSKSVYVANYYTVTCHPDSVSTNRLYFEATSTGTVAGVNGVTLADHPDLVRPTTSDKLYWVKEGGKGASIYARTLNTNYYKITAIKGYPTVDSTFSKTGKSDYLYIAVSNKYTTQPYDIWASAGVYGSKTGDSSHLGLWMELACISLMGLCAAAVFGRRKLKKQ